MPNKSLLGLEDVHAEVLATLTPKYPTVAALIADVNDFTLGEATATWLRSQYFMQALKKHKTVFLALRGDPIAIITDCTLEQLQIPGTPMMRINLMDFRENSRIYFRAMGSFFCELTNVEGDTVATVVPLSFYHLNKPGGPKWTQDMPLILVKEDAGLYEVPMPIPEPPRKRGRVPKPATVQDTVNLLLNEVTVLDPQFRDTTMLDASDWPLGHWAVADEKEIIATFKHEPDANGFRLYLVNARINGPLIGNRYTR